MQTQKSNLKEGECGWSAPGGEGLFETSLEMRALCKAG